MALPLGGKVPWVPDSWKMVYDKYTEFDAWYAGDPNKLAAVHSNKIHTPTRRGMHWAKEAYEERVTMLHVPMAGDIAQTSASLLFSEAPKIRIPDADEKNSEAKASQDRLEEIINEGGIFNRLIEAAETCSAMSGVFIKANWDMTLTDMPIFGVAQADTAIPEFKWGFLQAVTFWREFEDDEVIWRHLERHEMAGGVAYILNGLYRGSKDELGPQVGLTNRPETAELPPSLNTGLPSLLVRYIPNMKPNRMMRGSNLGQSDYAGVEGLMDALDEVYTSWMRDIRLGLGRIIVPDQWLNRDVDGEFRFSMDQEVYTTLDMDPMSAEKAGITISQFKIRTEEHYKTAQELIYRIVSNAGYSPQTFGLNIDGKAESGTALNIRERKSFLTKSKKERYFKPAIEAILELMLMIDKSVFNTGITPFRPSIEFSDSLINDFAQSAASVELINRAQAASMETKVRILHPDWNKEQVEEEVKKIKDDTNASIQMPNPDATGNDLGPDGKPMINPDDAGTA